MAQRDDKKRLGKKHRQASTRPKKGRAPRVTPTTGAVDPRKRKVLAAKKAAADKKKRTPTRSPPRESRHTPHSANIGRPEPEATDADLRAWDRAEQLAAQLDLASPGTEHLAPSTLP